MPAAPSTLPVSAPSGPDPGPERAPDRGPRPRGRRSLVLYLLPAIVLLGLVYVIPILETVRYSFGRATLTRGIIEWVGFDNYVQLLSPEVIAATLRTLVWVGVSLPVALAVGTTLAFLLDAPFRGRPVIRVLIILPWLFPEAISAVMWNLTLHPTLGVVNNALMQSGLIGSSINFFSTDSALGTVIAIRIWRSVPFVVLTVMAALQSIPDELVEASRMDGASLWQTVWHIKLPLVRPTIWSTGVILTAWSVVIFDMVFILTGGGPDRATELLSIYIYDSAFKLQDFGGAAAASMLLVALVAGLGYFYVRNTEREER